MLELRFIRENLELVREKTALRGLDPALVTWLKSEGKGDFPENFRITDAHPAPKGWKGGYWNNLYGSLGLPRNQ